MKSKRKSLNRGKLSDAQKAEMALKEAFVELVRERRKTGETMIFWKNGKVVEIPAADIPNSALRIRLKAR